MKEIKLTLLIVLTAFLSGCLFYDYGVDKKTTKLPYRTYYSTEKNKKYDFTTVLFSIENGPKGNNYSGFNISISHMYKSTQKRHKGKYISKIDFANLITDDQIQVIPESIVLTHRSKESNEIPYEKLENDLPKEAFKKYRRNSYIKTYNPRDLPKDMIEYIYIEVIINGEKEKIEYTLPIEKALHYTWLEMIMGA